MCFDLSRVVWPRRVPALIAFLSIALSHSAFAQDCPDRSRPQPFRRFIQPFRQSPTPQPKPVYRDSGGHHYRQPTTPVHMNRTNPVVATPVIALAPNRATPPPVSEAMNKTDVAKAFFETRQYDEALPYLDRVIQLRPKDTNAYQFRSLVHFARGDYEHAAADAYDAFYLGNAWTKRVLIDIYRRNPDYPSHLRRLSLDTQNKPSMPKHFLMAYHGFVRGELAEGRTHLRAVLALKPGEPLSTQLLAATLPKGD